ncbi:MAG: DUF2892 domain-containing protein [Betaproteobacteria bacterium]|nr:DUF2892 domain-containing protein [Betaproteobacteria bacterium]
MTRNVGNVDRIIRIVVGLGLLSLVYFLDGNARWWGLLGLGPIATAAMGYCPPYALIGINTCGNKAAAPPK